MKLTPKGVISPILVKESNKFHNTSELLGQAPGSSLPVYSDHAKQSVCTTLDENSLSFAQIKKGHKRSGLNF